MAATGFSTCTHTVCHSCQQRNNNTRSFYVYLKSALPPTLCAAAFMCECVSTCVYFQGDWMCGSRQAVKIQATLACSIMNLFSSLVAEKKKNRKRECATSQTFTSALPRPFIIISVTMLFSLLKKRGDFKWCVKTYHTVGRAQTVDALLKSLGSNSSSSYPAQRRILFWVAWWLSKWTCLEGHRFESTNHQVPLRCTDQNLLFN